jgi:DNA-binding transcriptional MerR regulator
MKALKVGELAKRTGITVRTLHHYDELGLLSPSRRDGSRYRLYTEEDVARLQQILSLRQLGFSLEEVRRCLASPDYSPLRVVEMHVERLSEQIDVQQRLRAKLEALAEHMRSTESVSAEEFIETLEMMTMFEKYYTAEQLQELEQRRLAVGEERMKQSQQDWAELMAEVRAEMDRGTDPSDPRVRKLAERWTALIREFTGGNPQIEKSLQRMYQEEPVIHGMEVAPMREMGEYISRAMRKD